MKSSLLIKAEQIGLEDKLSIAFDKLILNIKNEKYSEEELEEILKFFDSLENTKRIDSYHVDRFYKLVHREFLK